MMLGLRDHRDIGRVSSSQLHLDYTATLALAIADAAPMPVENRNC